jgi:hypothetical protein
MKRLFPSIRNCFLIKKIYKEKLYYNRNRVQHTFCKIIQEMLNEDSNVKNNDSKNKTK